jgi:hypothetical protein
MIAMALALVSLKHGFYVFLDVRDCFAGHGLAVGGVNSPVGTDGKSPGILTGSLGPHLGVCGPAKCEKSGPSEEMRQERQLVQPHIFWRS